MSSQKGAVANHPQPTLFAKTYFVCFSPSGVSSWTSNTRFSRTPRSSDVILCRRALNSSARRLPDHRNAIEISAAEILGQSELYYFRVQQLPLVPLLWLAA